jgi:hypothetical protein
MEPERIALSQRERDRLKMLHQVEQKQVTQVEAGRRLQVTDRHIRRLLVRLQQYGDGALVHGLRGQPSNRRLLASFAQRVLARVRRRYADFGPTLAAEHLAQDGLAVSRETLRKWMREAGLWRVRPKRAQAVHVWRERRACFGELVLQDSSPYRWLEDRGPACHLLALIDDATSRIRGRFAEHDTTAENFRALEGWLRRWGRPLAVYTDRDSIFQPAGPRQIEEELHGAPARTQFGRALAELEIEWIPAYSPQAKGRIERLFRTLQDRLVKEMRLAGVDTIADANWFLQTHFLPQWEERFTVAPRRPHDAHRPLGREHRLEEILSERVVRSVGQDHTVKWRGERWGVPRQDVCAGLRGARAEIERRLDGSHWLRFRGRYLPLVACPAPPPGWASPFGLRPTGLADQRPQTSIRRKYHPPSDHPWRRPWKRTFLSCEKPDISTLR